MLAALDEEVLKTDVLLEPDGVDEPVAGGEPVVDGVPLVLDDGVSFGVAVGSSGSLDDELVGLGETVPKTGAVRVGVPEEVDVPVGVGLPVDVGLLDGVVVVELGVGWAVLAADGAAARGRGALTGTPGRWVWMLGGTREGTCVARSRVESSRDVPEVRVGSTVHGVEGSVERGGADDGGGPTTAGAPDSPQKPWVT